MMGECPRCLQYGNLVEVETPVAKVEVCEGCAKERAMVMYEKRNAKALRRGACLRCGKKHLVDGKEKYINGFCFECAMQVIIDHG